MAENKILIADDEPLNLMLYSEMLKSDGYLIITAKNGLEAVQLAINEQPGIIILDWNMPIINGLEALKEIKKNPQTKDIPVIMITGIMTLPENLKLALESGAIDFLRKPFDKVELLARVKSMLLLAYSMKELQEKYLAIERFNRFINTLMESIPHPLVYYSLEGIIRGCNHKFQDLFDLREPGITGTRIYDYCKSTGFDIHQKKDRKLLESGLDMVYECKLGPMMHDYIFTKTLYFQTPEQPEGILCMMTDITDLKQAHEEIVDSKKRELTSSALRLIQISEMNNNLISELEKVNEHTSKKGNEIIKSIVNQFNINSGENVWKEFEARFENVYESFYNGLNSLFPDLTPGEKKLCALLRLNLSSKDIAAITFQNSQSIDMARYRLRKKLNLNAEENLVDYLMKIN